MLTIDEPLPSDCRPGLLKVDAHDDEEVLGGRVGVLLEQLGVLERRAHVVHRAWPNDYQEAVIVAVEDCLGGPASLEDCRGGWVDRSSERREEGAASEGCATGLD